MTPRTWLAIGAVAALVACGWIYTHHKDAQVTEAIHQSAVLEGRVDALKTESQAHKALADQAGQAVAVQDQTISGQGKVIADLKGRLAKAVHPVSPNLPPTVAGNPDQGVSVDALKDDLIAAQDVQITDQSQQIDTLKIEVSELRVALDVSGKALATSEQRARGLEIALDAQRSSMGVKKWWWRVEGFVLGAAGGYVAGRVRP